MFKKRGLVLALFAFIIFSLSFVSVSAEGPGDGISNVIRSISDGIGGAVEGLEPALRAILGDVEGVGDFTSAQILFAKLLIFILLMAIIWTVVKRIPLFNEHDWVIWIISIVIPVLGLRFFTKEMVLAASMPSTALAIAITSLLPLIIWVVFVETSITSRTMRKVAWVFAGCIFLGLYLVRFSDIGSIAYWYLLAAALCGSMFFFAGTIQRWRAKALLDKARAQGKGRGILHLRGLLRQVHDQYSHDGASYYSVFAGGGVRLRGDVGYEADVRELERRITHLMAT